MKTIKNQKKLTALINIRLARLQLALNKTNQALISLNKIKENSGWEPIIENIRGDILLKLKDTHKALYAYFKGTQSNGPESIKKILKLKIKKLLN